MKLGDRSRAAFIAFRPRMQTGHDSRHDKNEKRSRNTGDNRIHSRERRSFFFSIDRRTKGKVCPIKKQKRVVEKLTGFKTLNGSAQQKVTMLLI